MPESNARRAEKRVERKAAGVCTTCGKNPPADADHSMCATCRDYYKKCRAKYVANNRCRRCGREREKGKKCCEVCLRKQRDYVNGMRHETIMAYGGYKCACCGETHKEFLQLDHLHNNGSEHRREVGSAGGDRLYLWLKKHGYPPIMQILCANCNYAKAHYGYCPHHPDKKTNDAPTRRVADLS